MLPEVEDKERPSSSKSFAKKPSQPAKPKPSKGMTAPKGDIPEAHTGKATLVSSVKVSPPGQTKSEAALVELTQDQSSKAATEEAVGGAKLIQSPPASGGDNQTPPASPRQGSTTLISPSKLVGNLGALELRNEVQVRPPPPSIAGRRGKNQASWIHRLSPSLYPGVPKRGRAARRGSWRSEHGQFNADAGLWKPS